MVLTSLLSLGTKYGSRAEERTHALLQAQTLLDEYVAGLGNPEPSLGGSSKSEESGELNGLPKRSYRIQSFPFNQATLGEAKETSELTDQRRTELLRVTLELFEGDAGSSSLQSAKPLFTLSRLVRSIPQSQTSSTQEPLTSAQGLQGGRGVP